MSESMFLKSIPIPISKKTNQPLAISTLKKKISKIMKANGFIIKRGTKNSVVAVRV